MPSWGLVRVVAVAVLMLCGAAAPAYAADELAVAFDNLGRIQIADPHDVDNDVEISLQSNSTADPSDDYVWIVDGDENVVVTDGAGGCEAGPLSNEARCPLTLGIQGIHTAMNGGNDEFQADDTG